MKSHILGIAYHLPQKVETNEDLARENPDWQVDKIYEKSGIAARHIADEKETAGDLGCAAAAKLLANTNRDEIDYLLYCTQSPDYFLPTTACILQQRLGLGRHVGAFDFNLGCSGYIYGLQLAKSLVETGMARQVLLITADTYTKYIHRRDRTVRTLFGDGAAATLIGGVAEGPGAIGQFVLGTDGQGAKNLIVPSGCARLPRSEQTSHETTDAAGCVRSQDNLFMDGPAIFTFAITEVPRTVEALLKKTQLAPDKVDWYVYHQANKFMLQHLAQRSRIPAEKMVIAFEQIGNTVSASIPIALQMQVEAGKILPGHRLILVGFGVGYSWGACDVTWG